MSDSTFFGLMILISFPILVLGHLALEWIETPRRRRTRR